MPMFYRSGEGRILTRVGTSPSAMCMITTAAPIPRATASPARQMTLSAEDRRTIDNAVQAERVKLARVYEAEAAGRKDADVLGGFARALGKPLSDAAVAAAAGYREVVKQRDVEEAARVSDHTERNVNPGLLADKFRTLRGRGE